MSKKETPVMTMTVGDGASYDPVDKEENVDYKKGLIYMAETGEWITYEEFMKVTHGKKIKVKKNGKKKKKKSRDKGVSETEQD